MTETERSRLTYLLDALRVGPDRWQSLVSVITGSPVVTTTRFQQFLVRLEQAGRKGSIAAEADAIREEIC